MRRRTVSFIAGSEVGDERDRLRWDGDALSFQRYEFMEVNWVLATTSTSFGMHLNELVVRELGDA
jgi:hypothetical protein